ncbi:amiloride-sensitive sodium channel subunit gamma-2 [Biomphalaria pfeifferi]|uniref:Amiloride-sensitive sodium channel subunit gamma-2 n=1 Tax=Biomphalaria pfeifferi TaxID=112525 RepID=A0AAD8F8L3_BIOPF|nr:amiloride-sensitive sodium channel subunit gamma-2 [Biomphalaria pfeifferi]
MVYSSLRYKLPTSSFHIHSTNKQQRNHPQTKNILRLYKKKDIYFKMEKMEKEQQSVRSMAAGISLIGVAQASKTENSSYVKVLWAFLTVIASAVLIFHLSFLFAKYRKYSKHADINIGFSHLDFPAVTVCNVNIMRKSMVKHSSKEMQGFVSSLNTNDWIAKAANSSPTTNTTGAKNIVKRAADTANTDTYYDTANDYNDDYVPSFVSQMNEYYDEYVIRQKMLNSFLDSFDNGFDLPQDTYEDLFYKSYNNDSWEAVSNRSTIATLVENFKHYYSLMNITQQKNVSHQVRDMFRQCSFATRTCENSYKQTTNSEFGNCYTIEDSRYVSKKSGPAGGLELILFLENDEYLPLVTSGRGAHVIIHDRDTVPLPDDEGIAIPVGQQTMIGLKETNISRLGGHYIACKDVDKFHSTYGVSYTRNLCQKMCLLRKIHEKCKCLDTHYNYINILMKFVDNRTCLTQDEVHCLTEVKDSFVGDEESCGCYSPCSEKVYDAYISSRQWPNDDIAEVLIQEVCNSKPNVCNTLKNKTSVEKRESFLKLNIFYRDLNFQEMKEESDYDKYQLMSDFGGTIGLWLGLSILSAFEIVQLFLGAYCILLKKADKRREKKRESKKKAVAETSA